MKCKHIDGWHMIKIAWICRQKKLYFGSSFPDQINVNCITDLKCRARGDENQFCSTQQYNYRPEISNHFETFCSSGYPVSQVELKKYICIYWMKPFPSVAKIYRQILRLARWHCCRSMFSKSICSKSTFNSGLLFFSTVTQGWDWQGISQTKRLLRYYEA